MKINPEVSNMMQKIAQEVHTIVPEGKGFAVLVFDFDEPNAMDPSGELHWVSNAERQDMIRAMQEFVRRESN